MKWTQQTPRFVEVGASNVPLRVGDVRQMWETGGHGAARMAVLGPATREDYIRTRGKEPREGRPHFYWVHFD